MKVKVAAQFPNNDFPKALIFAPGRVGEGAGGLIGLACDPSGAQDDFLSGHRECQEESSVPAVHFSGCHDKGDDN